MVDEKGITQEELRGAEAVIGLQFCVLAFEDGEGVIAFIQKRYQAVGLPADEDHLSGPEFFRCDAGRAEEAGFEGGRALEFLPPGVERREADESAQYIQCCYPRRRPQAHIAPQPLERGRRDILVDVPLDYNRQRLKVRGGVHLTAVFSLHFLQQEGDFWDGVGHGSGCKDSNSIPKTVKGR